MTFKKLLIPFFTMTLLVGCGTDSSSSNIHGTPQAIFHTSMGDITLELYPDKAPKTVENFITHAKNGYYNQLQFHRVIPDFMIQGGDPNGNGSGGESIWGGMFEDESNDLTFDTPGMLAMANRGPNTNGSQFFITQAPTPWLQGHHTIFGKVTDGMDIVNTIANVKRDASDRPLEAITYTIEIIE